MRSMETCSGCAKRTKRTLSRLRPSDPGLCGDCIDLLDDAETGPVPYGTSELLGFIDFELRPDLVADLNRRLASGDPASSRLVAR